MLVIYLVAPAQPQSTPSFLFQDFVQTGPSASEVFSVMSTLADSPHAMQACLLCYALLSHNHCYQRRYILITLHPCARGELAMTICHRYHASQVEVHLFGNSVIALCIFCPSHIRELNIHAPPPLDARIVEHVKLTLLKAQPAFINVPLHKSQHLTLRAVQSAMSPTRCRTKLVNNGVHAVANREERSLAHSAISAFPPIVSPT